ncbi:MAG: T9SS type A sorting domain-containing protein, partial [Bacteroidales bacterium]|nr:T9SS type A sorting domain-containing protein [Bacteroidales bacterium]
GYLVSYQQGNTKTFSHMLNNEDVIQHLTRTENSPYSGWNLLGNPYPSAIKWNTGSWGDLAAMNLNAHARVWNRTAKSYTTIAPGGVIPAMNGFMVQLTDGNEAQITIPGAERIHDSQPWYKSDDTQLIRLIAFEQDDQSYQESKILIHPSTSETFNAYHDARFLPGYAPLFYSIKEAENLSVYSVPAIHDELVIPFEFIKNQADNFRIELAETFDNTELSLFDKKLEKEHALNPGNPYFFDSADTDHPLRFELRFSKANTSNLPSIANRQVNIYTRNNILVLNFTEETSGDRLLQVFDLSGKLILSKWLDRGRMHQLPLSVSPGFYVVKISQQAIVFTHRIFVN